MLGISKEIKSSSKELKQNCIIILEGLTLILEAHFLEMQDFSCLTRISELASFLKLNIIADTVKLIQPTHYEKVPIKKKK